MIELSKHSFNYTRGKQGGRRRRDNNSTMVVQILHYILYISLVLSSSLSSSSSYLRCLNSSNRRRFLYHRRRRRRDRVVRGRRGGGRFDDDDVSGNKTLFQFVIFLDRISGIYFLKLFYQSKIYTMRNNVAVVVCIYHSDKETCWYFRGTTTRRV